MRDSITAAVLCFVCVAALATGAVAQPLAGGHSPATQQGAAQLQQGDSQTYAVTQGDQCIEIQALGNGSQTVEEFYDYRNPETHDGPNNVYSSYGTQELQRGDTTTMFVYEGSQGTSLVVIHERIGDDSDGGAVTMQFDGLAENSEWAVQDDVYNGTRPGGNLDEWSHSGTSARATWAYTGGRNDGGALRGFGEDVTITPYFNDSADFREYDGDITQWDVVSASGGEYNRTALDSLTEEVTVSAGRCAELTASSVTTSPSSPDPGETVDIQATVQNDGSRAGSFSVEIAVGGEVIDTREIELESGESRELSVSTTFEDAGTYEIAVADTTTSVQVGGAGGSGPADVLPGFGVAAALVALAAVAVGARRYQ
ncbi:CARDB protein [Natronoarchaeum philippinense]|uniref:CARDB protein n=1 Tax=Natronoarchaeum philippinense TaxID=558529 RepID=A0A285P5F1_NATPI|nr:CARDB domain-containing protein [Natronoarchaeum philippinense]SNZ16944.1 CARDB protein [Natronoarchaeum philippinense]